MMARDPVGYGWSQFRENWCPACKETFQTEKKGPLPEICRFCGSQMPKKPESPLGKDVMPLKRRRYGHKDIERGG